MQLLYASLRTNELQKFVLEFAGWAATAGFPRTCGAQVTMPGRAFWQYRMQKKSENEPKLVRPTHLPKARELRDMQTSASRILQQTAARTARII